MGCLVCIEVCLFRNFIVGIIFVYLFIYKVSVRVFFGTVWWFRFVGYKDGNLGLDWDDFVKVL